MAILSGFQPNSTLQTLLWIYRSDDTKDVEVVVNLGLVQYIEATSDHKLVSLYYAESSRATTQGPKELRGAVAQQFMADLEALFIP